MSISSLFGVIAGFGLFLAAIALATPNFFIFFSMQSFVLVLGGTLASAFLSYEARYVLLALRDLGRIFRTQKINRDTLHMEIGRMIKWGYLVKKEGRMALDKSIKNMPKEHFMRFALQLLLSNYKAEEIREMLGSAVESTYERNVVMAGILRSMASTSPAFGMIGTLVGLVIMLNTMNSNPDQLGPGLALALLTTLYGVLLARLVFLPAASKIQQREEIYRFRNHLITEGFTMMAEEKTPGFIQDHLNSFLDPLIHFEHYGSSKQDLTLL